MFAESGGGYPRHLFECAAKVAVIGKTAALHDLPNAEMGVSKQLLGVGHTAGLQIFHNGNAGGRLEAVGQGGGAYTVFPSQVVQIIMDLAVVFKLTLQICHHIVVSAVEGHSCASVDHDQQLLDQQLLQFVGEPSLAVVLDDHSLEQTDDLALAGRNVQHIAKTRRPVSQQGINGAFLVDNIRVNMQDISLVFLGAITNGMVLIAAEDGDVAIRRADMPIVHEELHISPHNKDDLVAIVKMRMLM